MFFALRSGVAADHDPVAVWREPRPRRCIRVRVAARVGRRRVAGLGLRRDVSRDSEERQRHCDHRGKDYRAHKA